MRLFEDLEHLAILAAQPRRSTVEDSLGLVRDTLEGSDACLDALGADFTFPAYAECRGGQAVGAIRLSMGLGSVRSDVEAAVKFFESYLK